MSAVQLGPPRVSIPNRTLWGSRTSIEDGNAGQLELPARTTANFEPFSSQPAEGKGYARSRVEESVFAVTASAGRPPWCSDSAIEAGVVEHAVSSADMETIQIQIVFPMCRGYLASSGSSLPATVREVLQSYGGGLSVGGVVAEHGPEDVEAAPGQGEHGLDVCFSFAAFAVVVDPGGGAAFQG